MMGPPTHSPWLNPIEMRRCHSRREVTHCGCSATRQALLAAQDSFARSNQRSRRTLSVTGPQAASRS